MIAVPKPIKVKKESKVQEWNRIRAELKPEFETMGITACELRLENCVNGLFLGFAHTMKRREIESMDNPKERERLLRRVALACDPCHSKIEYACRRWTGKTMKEFVEGIIANRDENPDLNVGNERA